MRRPTEPMTKRPKLRANVAVVLVLLAVLTHLRRDPGRADLTTFDPVETTRIDMPIWRHYSDKRFAVLFVELYRVGRASVSPETDWHLNRAVSRRTKIG
jgi:hypothetical protein